jgi:hypothetical protein
MKPQAKSPALITEVVAFSPSHLKDSARAQHVSLLEKVDATRGPLDQATQFQIYHEYAKLGISLTTLHGCSVSTSIPMV